MNRLKLLIVDDIEINRFLLSVICHDMKEFEIHEAVDGQDALEQCEKLRPDIILMDIMMPRLDGFQASRQIKDRYPDTIIIAVTTMTGSDTQKKMAAAGMLSHIPKPIVKDQLCSELKNITELLSVNCSSF